MASTVTVFVLFTFVFVSFSSNTAIGSNLAYPASAYYNLNPAPYSPVVWPQLYFNYHPASASTEQRQSLPYQLEYNAHQIAATTRAGPILTALSNFCQGVYSGPSCPVCPVCSACANTCPTCKICEICTIPFVPTAGNLNSCPTTGTDPFGGSSASPSGTMTFTVPASGCDYVITAYDPTKTIKVTCGTIPSQVYLLMKPDASNKETDAGTEYSSTTTGYTVTGGYVKVKFQRRAGSAASPAICTWETV